MSDHTTSVPADLPVDELWLADWAAVGLAALEAYLAKHAAFAAFLAEREGLHSDDGHGAAR